MDKLKGLIAEYEKGLSRSMETLDVVEGEDDDGLDKLIGQVDDLKERVRNAMDEGEEALEVAEGSGWKKLNDLLFN
jgi:hypothetical protein